MHVLFIHGMGRSPLSGWPLRWHLRRRGFRTATFAYNVSLQDFETIRRRLVARIEAVALKDDYVLVGHSLGGVLARAAVNSLPAHVKQPRHLFLLASPIQPARLAQGLQSNLLFKWITRDCGRLLGSEVRMSQIGPVSCPTTGIAGVRGFSGKRSPFKDEANDGIVALSEVSADWIADQVQVSVAHTFMPSSQKVARLIAERLARGT